MLVFPNCKINLGLKVSAKRKDGYHDIETIFYPVPLKDALELIHITDVSNHQSASFSNTGIAIAGDSHENLCIKAWHLLKNDFPGLPSVQIHLHKAIPVGAGLGGGSADAAFTLSALNEKFMLNLSVDQLQSYAFRLGSDCPFFIVNKPCIASGRGEILQEANLNLSGYQLALVNPGIHINTGWAFGQLGILPDDENTGHTNGHVLLSIVSQPIPAWKNLLSNDFEQVVFNKYPAIGSIKDALYESGALFASLSGSGSTVFGIFPPGAHPSLDFPLNYYTRQLLL